MPPEFVPTTPGQRDRLEAQTGGRRGSTQGRQQGDPRDMYGPRREGRSAQQGMPTGRTGFDSGSGEKAGTLSQQEFMNVTGRTETNPYGNEGFFSRVFGIDPSKINYAATTPGGIATLNKVNALAYDQYLNPRDARGNIRGFLREGSPTRFGTVTYDPTLETDLGIMGALPVVGPLMRRANRRSALNISSYDNPLFSEMGDLGNELGEFPEGSVAAAPVAQAAPTNAISDVFEPFTTDPDVRNPESYFADINTRPQETPVTPGFTRPDDVTVADVLAAEPMVTTPKGRIPGYVDPVIDPDTGMVVEGGTRLPTGPKVVQAIPAGDPGSASITAVGRGPGAVSGEIPVTRSDILSPENIAEILELPGRDPDAPAPFDMIDALSPSLPPAPPAQPRGSRDIVLVMPDGRVIDSRNAGQ